MARRIIVEVEVPEGRSIEEILQGVKYRVIEEDRRKRLRELFRRIEEKNVRVERIPSREEIYADRA